MRNSGIWFTIRRILDDKTASSCKEAAFYLPLIRRNGERIVHPLSLETACMLGSSKMVEPSNRTASHKTKKSPTATAAGQLVKRKDIVL